MGLTARPTGLRLGLAAACGALAGCGTDVGLSFLDPKGPVADAQWWHMIEVVAVLAIVVLPLFVLVPFFAWRYRYGARTSTYAPRWSESTWLEVVVWGVPILIVAFLVLLLVRSTFMLDPYKPLAAGDLYVADGALSSGKPPMRVQVVGTDWKWLFLYPEQGIATVGEMAFPIDRQLELDITSMTAMQSFFIPSLGSQIYAMGGMSNRLHLAADEPGEFLGQNTQYNGVGFHEQKFVARAVPAEDFAAWIDGIRETGAPLDDAALSVLTERNTLETARANLPDAGAGPGRLAFDTLPDHLFERLMAWSRSSHDRNVTGPLPAHAPMEMAVQEKDRLSAPKPPPGARSWAISTGTSWRSGR